MFCFGHKVGRLHVRYPTETNEVEQGSAKAEFAVQNLI